MDEQVAALECRGERGAVVQVAPRNLQVEAFENAGIAAGAHERPHAGRAAQAGVHRVAADHARGAENECAREHRGPP